MTKGKGFHKYNTLTARELEAVQQSHMKEKFELAEQSVLAKKAVSITNQALERHEQAKGQERLKPGQMVGEHAGEQFVLPLLEQKWVLRLGSDMGLNEVKRHHEYDQYCRLLETDSAATYSTLWELLGTGSNLRRAPKDYDFLPEEPQTVTLELSARNPDDLAVVPTAVLKEATAALVDDYGCKPGQAEAMVTTIAGIRAWCSPHLSELKSGQVVWLAYSTKRKRRGGPRLFVPAVLTLMTAEEQKLNISHYGQLRALKIRQIERITTEAWQQNAVLTASDLEWLLGVSSAMLRNLLEAYQEKFGVVLPTAGTVLDMGRTLTHKKLVIEMSLSGMTTNEIAARVFHSALAVDAYLKTFDKLLVLRYYRMPYSAIMRVLGHSRKLIEEHMAIADKHFSTEEELSNYLEGRGVTLEQIC